jgi:hypothetical protein
VIDHLVYAVADLNAACTDIEQRTGIRPSYGGQHVGLGTHNAVLDLGDAAYVELLAPDPSQDESTGELPFGLHELSKARLVTWAAKAGTLRERVERARAAGFDPGDVVSIQRRLPDGTLLEWELTNRPGAQGGDGIVPYLIDWADVPHPTTRALPGCRLRSLRGEHPHPESVRAELAALDIDLPVDTGASFALVAVIETPKGTLTLR